MQLNQIWFLIVGFLFIGYFVLDGFDFGVGMSLPFLGKDDTDRRVLINTIGPVWDLNETWVLVAGASLFASFPEWYASLFSGFYLALLLILAALIARGVAFEYRGKSDSLKWRRTFDWMIVIGSALPALLWGVAFSNIVEGVPLNADHVFTGTLFTLLNPYGLLGGLVTLTLFFTHGLVFITLKTDGELKLRARALASRVGVIATALAASFLIWTLIANFSVLGFILSALAAVSLIAALWVNHIGREGISFSLMVFTIVTAVGSLFAALYPNVLPSTINPAFSLNIDNASSSQYTLTVMTWVAAIMIPFVLAYQSWTYWVFRKRISRKAIPANSH
jgi:cytochrome d ubiquinol oxidase subunit II